MSESVISMEYRFVVLRLFGKSWLNRVSTRKVFLGYAKCIHTFIHRCNTSTHLKAKRLCESLAKIRVCPWLCKSAAGVRRISKKGKDCQNESTCRASYLHWWNFPASRCPEHTLQRFVEMVRMEQDKTNKQRTPKTINSTNSSKGEAAMNASVWEIAASL